MRVADEATLGNAKASITFEGWPVGRVLASTHELPEVPRQLLPNITLSREQERVLSADGYAVEELHLTPDGKRLVVVLTKQLKEGHLYQYRLWDAATGKELRKLFQIDPEPLLEVYSPFLVLSADSKHAAIHYNAIRTTKQGKDYKEENLYKVHLIDLDTGRENWWQDVLGRNTHRCLITPDSQTLVTGEYQFKETGKGRDRKREFTGEVWLWDATTGKRKSTLPGGPYQIVTPTKYSADGKLLVITDEHRDEQSDYRVYVWDLVSEKAKLKLTGFKGPTEGTLSPDGKRLATCGNTWTKKALDYFRDIRIWDLQSGKEHARLPMDPGTGWLRAFWSADGDYLFLASAQGALWRWDPSGARPLVKVESIVPDAAGKQPERDAWQRSTHVAAGLVAFGVNGKLPNRLTQRTLEEDYAELPPAEIVLWDLKTMKRRATFTGHHGQINHLTFSHDGRTIISGGSDGTVRFWKVPDAPSATPQP